MPSLLDEFMGSYGSEVSKQLSSNLGIDTNTAAQLIPQVAPLILGGLKRQSEQRGGQPRVDHILNKNGDPNALNNIGGIFSDMMGNKQPDPRLGGLLGDSGVQASDMMANQLNLNSDMAAKIIPMLAPVILGFLTQKRDTGGMGSNGLASFLDQNGDGSILDDVAGMLLQGMAGGGAASGGRRQSGGGLLGSLLGGLFGGKRR